MPSVKDLRDRIRSLKNTQQITKAMKQVAAAKIRRAEAAQKQARPYADALSKMLRDLMGAVSSVDHPFMKPGKADAPAGAIIMTADKGLAGAFNSNVIRLAEQYREANGSLGRNAGVSGVQFYSVGIKAQNAVRRLGEGERPSWALNSASKLETAREISKTVTKDFVEGKISKIVLISSKLVSMMLQRPESRTLIPITAELGKSEGGARGAVEFSPSPEYVLSQLLPKYLEFTIFSAMLETDAAFFAAQLIAMSNATDNAGKLVDELTIQMNNARQAAITKELLEIVAGAEALA